MKIKSIVRTYIALIRPISQHELDWFRQQPNLQSAIECAALAINRCGKRYRHQTRFKKTTLKRAKKLLLAKAHAIGKSKSFDELFATIDRLLNPIKGIGELYIYDTSLRIGAKLNKLPTKVYLHRGTRKGAKALGLNWKLVALEPSVLRSYFHPLKPHEIEDVLCIFKAELKNAELSEDDFSKRSWCT